MKFEYCETCQKMSGGKFMTANSKTVKTFLCGICNGITYINYGDYSFKEVYDTDLCLRNEAVGLQLKYYKALNTTANIRRIQ